MSLLPRLQTLGYWGVTSTPSFALNIAADATYEAAQRIAGGVVNLRRYRKGNDSGVTQSAIGLDFKTLYADAFNDTSVWGYTGVTGAFEEFPNAFNSNLQGLIYKSEAANAAARFLSTFIIAQNRAFSVRMFLFDTHEDQARQVVALMWERWRVEIVDRSVSIMRKATAWTAAKQLQLDTLLNTEEQLSESDQATADALRLEIYEEGYSGSVSAERKKTDNGEWFELTFIPEPRGILNIISDKDESSVERADIVATRQSGVLWPAVPLEITTNGGAMFWQVGFPQFARTGSLRTPTYKWWYQTGLETLGMTFSGQYDASSPGVTLGFDLVDVDDSIEYYAQADFTSDGNYTPFLYSSHGFVEAGDRTGSSDVTWDSDEVSDFDTNGTPIMDMSVQCEGEMLKRSASFLLRNVNGALGANIGTGQKFLHDRLATATLGGTPYITNGLVQVVQLGDANQATANVIESVTCNPWSTLTVDMSDQWAIMESDLMLDMPVGDGLTVGAYVRKILNGAGVKNSEMTGVDSATGRELPSAAPGESPLIVPSPMTSRADYLTSIVTDWGMGLRLYVSAAGVWTLDYPDTTIQAAFSSSATSGYRILQPLDIVRDFTDFYNWFCVEGAEINGRRLRGVWTIWESVFAPNWVGYIGKWKRFPIISSDAIRTVSDLNWVARSNVLRWGRPGRFFNFPTNFHKELIPGHRITCDSVECDIKRITGGSIVSSNSRSNITAQEYINPIVRRVS